MSGREEAEGIDEEIVKELIELRSYLEKRIQGLEEEAEKLKALFKIVDEVIVTRSFRMAESIPISQSKPSIPVDKKEGIPLKTASGVLLAEMYTNDSEIRIIPAEDLGLTVDTPPFQTFLISRILDPMQARDSEAAQRGEISTDKILSYEVLRDGDIINEIKIKNYGDERRLREIRTASRWTFEKMYEKIRSTS
ncbi:MAG: hypothetical protein QG670_932 [Thermoproteota archaeon]|nr:hypothetical protein [Thermoproteota archaeon]